MLNFILKNIDIIITFFHSVEEWVLIQMFGFVCLFGYYGVKWLLLDPQGQKVGKYILLRILLAIAINIQSFFWYDFIFCNEPKTSLVEDKTMNYVLVGASAVVLSYFVYRSATHFANVTYPNYIAKEKARIAEEKYEKLVQEAAIRFQKEQEALESTYNKFILESHKQVRLPGDLARFKAEMMNQLTLVDKSLMELNVELINQQKFYNSFKKKEFLDILQTEGYQKYGSDLENPQFLVEDYLVSLQKNIEISRIKLEESFTLLDLKIYEKFLQFTLSEIHHLDKSIVGFKGNWDFEYLVNIHERLQIVDGFYKRFGSDSLEVKVYALGEAGFLTNCLPPRINYMALHAGSDTLGNVAPIYVWPEFIVPEKVDSLTSLVDISLPMFYNVGVLTSYFMVSCFSICFGVSNPISREIAVQAFNNLIFKKK